MFHAICVYMYVEGCIGRNVKDLLYKEEPQWQTLFITPNHAVSLSFLRE